MVKIEGYSLEELLSLPSGDLDAFVFMGRPVVVKIGSAELLAERQTQRISVGRRDMCRWRSSFKACRHRARK